MRSVTRIAWLAALLVLAACAGSEKGNGISRMDSKSFWYSGYEDDEIPGDSGASPDSSGQSHSDTSSHSDSGTTN